MAILGLVLLLFVFGLWVLIFKHKWFDLTALRFEGHVKKSVDYNYCAFGWSLLLMAFSVLGMYIAYHVGSFEMLTVSYFVTLIVSTCSLYFCTGFAFVFKIPEGHYFSKVRLYRGLFCGIFIVSNIYILIVFFNKFM